MIILLFSFFLLSSIAFLTDDAPVKEKGTVLIAAASNLQFAMDKIIRIYRKKKPGIKIKIVYGSSGNFFNQIINGAPFDVFFSADFRYPEELVKKNMGNEVISYALGRIVVMAPVDSRIELQKSGLMSLLHPAVKKIAIANPAHAPYGKVAVNILKKLDIYETLKGKLILGENISQAAQFVESGAVDAGIIALALAIMAKESEYREIPTETYPSMEQGFIILNRTKMYSSVREFTDFVQSGEVRNVLLKYGFNVPEKKVISH